MKRYRKFMAAMALGLVCILSLSACKGKGSETEKKTEASTEQTETKQTEAKQTETKQTETQKQRPRNRPKHSLSPRRIHNLTPHRVPPAPGKSGIFTIRRETP